MAEHRQPDYDFFGPGRAPQRPSPQQAPQQAPPPAYGAPAPQPYGVPPPRYAAPGGLPPAPYLVPRRSRAVTALIVAAAVMASLVVAGIVAAVAIPVFLNQRMRAEWKATTVGLPDTFDGGARSAVPAAVRSQLAAVAEQLASSDAASYRTDGGVTVFVVAGKGREPLTEADGEDVRRGMLDGMAESGLSVSLAESDPGRLGGWFGCGSLGAAASVCLATDHASVVILVVAGSDDPTTVARRMRETAVRR